MSTDAGSLRRGVALLRLLATAGRRGLALTELSARAALPHPSVHRLLAQLVDERLAIRHEDSRRYALGPLAFELGLAGAAQFDIRDFCDAAMARLADATEDTVYLVVRGGDEAVCQHRREGAFPIRTLTLDVGSRRPLGLGAGGLAILAALPEDERTATIARIRPQIEAHAGMSLETLQQSIDAARAHGLAVIHNRVTLGVTAVGIHLDDSLGRPMAAISVAALNERMSAQRIGQIGTMLRSAARDVQQALREGGAQSPRVRRRSTRAPVSS
jgi:DNA-binding IclR family transcriptional regulator